MMYDSQFLVTTVQDLEEYDILEYLGIVSGGCRRNQDAAHSLSGFSELVDEAVDNMRMEALKRNANAIIGMNIQYTPGGQGGFDTVVVVGTAVVVRSVNQSPLKQNVVRGTIICPVTDYCLENDVRPCEVHISALQGLEQGNDNLCEISLKCKDYGSQPINALTVSIQLIDQDGDKLAPINLLFSNLTEKNKIIKTEHIDYPIKKRLLPKLIAAQVKLVKYATPTNVVEGGTRYLQTDIPLDLLTDHKQVFGIDVITTRTDLPGNWRCVCGKVNPLKASFCALCGRTVKNTDPVIDMVSLKQQLSEQSNARGIRDLMESYSGAIQVDKFRELTARLDKIAMNERLYGNSKDEAVAAVQELVGDYVTNITQHADTSSAPPEPEEEAPPAGPDFDKLFSTLEQLPNAASIRDVAAQYAPLLDPQTFAAMKKELDRIAFNEKLYGNSKQDALLAVKKTLESPTDPTPEPSDEFDFKKLYRELEQQPTAREIKNKLIQNREAIDKKMLDPLLNSLDEIIRNERIDQSRKQEALFAVRQQAGDLLKESF